MKNKQFLTEKIPQKLLNANKTRPLVKAILLGLGLATLSDASHAWSYLGESDSNGVPKVMVDKSPTCANAPCVPADLIDRVHKLLPEGVKITSNPESMALLADDIGSNIFLKKDAKITVAFVHEGAGYKNGIGFFPFTLAALNSASVVPADKIIFPNLSFNGSGGNLVSGNAVELGEFTAGTAIGFTVVANGWDSSTHTVKSSPSEGIFRTIKKLNPETLPLPVPNNAHTVLLSSPTDSLLVLGIEDLNRTPGAGSDEDFNDAVLAIFVDPFDAIDTSNLIDITTGKKSGGGGGGKGVSGRLNWREITTPN